jgi:transposase
MRPRMSLTQIYLYPKAIDFRKLFWGTRAIVECELGHNPFTGHLYVFTNKIKCLFWENNGFVLYYNSLEEDKFIWPKHQKEVMTLYGQQINWLLDGLDISAPKLFKLGITDT